MTFPQKSVVSHLIALGLCLGASLGQVIPGPNNSGGPTSVVVGQVQTATGGTINNGALTFKLSQPAVVAGSATIATQQTSCYTSGQGNIVGVPDATATPVVSGNLSAGTLPAGTYYVKLYYIGAGGVGELSPEIAFNLSSQGTVIVSAPGVQPNSAAGYGVAIGTSSGSETIQGVVTGWTQYSQSVPLIAGATPQALNTSFCSVYLSDQLVPTGTNYSVNLINKNGSPIAGFPQTWCMYGGAGATINVSNGAPTGNCNTNGVFYPTPIFSNPANSLIQSIFGGLNIGTTLNVGGSTTLAGLLVSGTTTLSGAVNVPGISYFVNPGAGADIGASLSACIAHFPTASTPGVCILAPGNYTLTQTLTKPQWVRIEGNNAVISVPSLATPALICATTQTLFPTIPGTYSRRGIANLTLLGSGPGLTPYGIWVGGDPAGVIVSSTAADFMEVFDNVHVQNFGAGYTLGKNISQELWLGGSIMGGYASAENGVVMPAGGGGSENLTFSGTQFIAGGGNTGFAILATNANGSTINLDHVSVDYWGSNNASGCPNSLGTGQIKYNNGHLVVDGGHFETCSGIQIVSDTTAIVEYSILGGSEFTLVDGTHALSTPAVIQVAGAFAQVTVEAGTLLSLAGGATQTIGAYVNNTVSGGQVYVAQYSSFIGSGYNQVPALGGTWNAGMYTTYSAGSLTGYVFVGGLSATGLLAATTETIGGGSTLNLYKRATDTPGAITVNANTCTDRPVTISGLLVTAVIIPTAAYAVDTGISVSAAQAVAGTAHYRICNVTAGNITLNAAAAFSLAILQ